MAKKNGHEVRDESAGSIDPYSAAQIADLEDHVFMSLQATVAAEKVNRIARVKEAMAALRGPRKPRRSKEEIEAAKAEKASRAASRNAAIYPEQKATEMDDGATLDDSGFAAS